MRMSKTDNLKRIPVDIWGTNLFVNESKISKLRGEKIDNASMALLLADKSRYESLSPDYEIISSWTTGIDFGHEYEGGGYTVSIIDEVGTFDYDIIAEADVEWYDSYAEEAGFTSRRDEQFCLYLALQMLQGAIDSSKE